MDEKNFMTQEGYEKTKERLAFLKTEKRQEVANKIAEARSYGDLSENSEYDIAREEQASVEAEIFELENKLKSVEIIDSKKVNTSKVSIGCSVSIQNVKTNQSFQYRIVGDTDADPLNGLISNVSPIGAGLIGKKVGEIAIIKTPAGIVQYKIAKITG
ncbi:MAG: transcription elongation factor GreA [Clostridia bacterium]|nr:transcription elongation factor GreA [Clostridia bacterium]